MDGHLRNWKSEPRFTELANLPIVSIQCSGWDSSYKDGHEPRRPDADLDRPKEFLSQFTGLMYETSDSGSNFMPLGRWGIGRGGGERV